jgi:hypothetical protein
VRAEKDEEVRIETEDAEIVLTNAGGRIRSWRLKAFHTAGRPVDLVSKIATRTDALPLSVTFDDRGILPDANRALYQITRSQRADGSEAVTFRWADGTGSSIEKTLAFPKGTPLAELEIRAVDRGRPVTPRVVWGPGLEAEDEKNRSNTYYADQAVVLDSDQVVRLARRKLDKAVVQPESPGSDGPASRTSTSPR